MKEVTYTIHIEPADEGGFFAYFPALPGCHTQGETVEAVIDMAKDALIGHLESLREHGEPEPKEEDQLKKVGFGFEFPLRTVVIR